MTINFVNPNVRTIEIGTDEFLLRQRFDADTNETSIDVYSGSNIWLGELRDCNFPEDGDETSKFEAEVEEFLKENYY